MTSDTDIDLFRQDLKADPHRELSSLRETTPLLWSERHRAWLVLGYSAVRGVLMHPEAFSSETTAMHRRRGTSPTRYQRVHVRWFVQKDPPAHTALRRFFGSYFTPRRVRQIESAVVDIVAGIVGELEGSGEVDFVDHVAVPLPSRVICDLLGVPASDADLFKRWTATLTDVQELDRNDDEIRAADEATVESEAYFRQLMKEKSRRPSDDIISHVLGTRDPAELDDDTLSANLFLLLAAGHETTINLLTNLMWQLANAPDEWAKLRQDPALSASASEEALRIDSPVYLVGRVAKQEFEIEGHTIPAGDPVITFLGVANRDPQVFERPDEFRIERSPNPHLAFGFAVHHCLGAPLARLESRCAYAEIARSLQSVSVKECERLDALMTRGFTSMTIEYQR